MAYSVGFLILSAFALGVHSQSANDDSQCFKDDLSQSDMQLSLDQIRRSLDRQKWSLQSSCPPGFNYSAPIVSKCYAIVGERLSWDAAQLRCRQLHPNAHLVVINSALENQILNEILGNYECNVEASSPGGTKYTYSTVWTAGQRQAIDNCNATFVWKPDSATFLSMTYTNWYPFEPNCANNQEACAVIYLSEGKKKLWNDCPCSWPMCSVCEIVLYDRF